MRFSVPIQEGRGFYSGQLYQKGGALDGFTGQDWPSGGGFSFGRFLWKHARPLLGYLARQTLQTGVNLGQDVLEGADLKEAAKSRLQESGKMIALDAIKK